MSLIVKIMSAEDLADDDTRKSHQLYTDVINVAFKRTHDGPQAEMLFADSPEPESFPLEGNVYVMNEAGKTISSFGVADPFTRVPIGSLLGGFDADAFAQIHGNREDSTLASAMRTRPGKPRD